MDSEVKYHQRYGGWGSCGNILILFFPIILQQKLVQIFQIKHVILLKAIC